MKTPSTAYRQRNEFIAKAFSQLCVDCGLGAPLREHRFHETRKWRFDYCFPKEMVALEVEGGVWTGGRHTRGAGFVKDMEKYNTATSMGWRIIRVEPSKLLKIETINQIKLTIKSTKHESI